MPCTCLILALMLFSPAMASTPAPATQPTADDGTPWMLSPAQTSAAAHHQRHAELFGRGINGINLLVLRGIDRAQATAPQGGGYFVGVHARPAESPIGYPLALFGHRLLDPPRTTSYCSGSSYTAFIEALNLIYPSGGSSISPARLEALRMQEPDGGRREDGIKFWGHWNDDGPGCQYALVQYSHMGVEIAPRRARPGDFMNISWVSGLGHSVVFLGWCRNSSGELCVRYWASQKGTDGLGDQTTPVRKIRSVKIVRLVNPERLFTFDPSAQVNRTVAGDPIRW